MTVNETADVVVVGGGVIGCAVAAELADRDIKTLLLERSSIAAGASGRNHGLLWYPQDEIKSPLYEASRDIYREIARTSPLDIALDDETRGMVITVSREEEWADAEAEAKLCEAGGIEVERLDASAITTLEPNLAEGHLGGYLINDGYRTDPAALTLALALIARDRGAEVKTHTEVKQFLVKDGAIKGVATDDGIVETEIVVNAAGPWAPKLARSIDIDLPVAGARGWLLLTRAIEPITNHLILTAGWHVTDAIAPRIILSDYSKGEPLPHDLGLLIQQNRSGHVLLGGTRIHSLAEEPERPELTHEIARAAIATMPRLADTPVISTWSGVRPMTPDGLPIIGWSSEVEGLFIATGHGGQGVILGGGSGRLVAQMIGKENPFTDPSPFTPSRFLD